MGRYLSTAVEKEIYYGIRDVTPNYGTGAFRFYGSSGTFTVPAATSEIRVTALGGGGGGAAARTPCLCNHGAIWCWAGPVCNTCNCATPTGLCWSTTFPCVGQSTRCFDGYNGCLFQLQAYCFGGGGGGGAYVIAKVAVTAGCVCCVIVGAAGTHCCGTLALNACCACGCDLLTLGSGGTGGFSCFPGVCAQGGGGGCLGACLVTAGIGGNGFVSGSAVCVVIRQGNTGCAGCLVYLCQCIPCSYFPTASIQPSGTIACTVCQCSVTPAIVSYGGASGSPVGPGAGTGPFPSTSGTDVYSCKGFDGSNNTENCLSEKWNNKVRWPGEVILSTTRTQTVIAGTAAGFPSDCYCVSHYGGAYIRSGQSLAISCTFGTAGCGGGGAGPYRNPVVNGCLTKSFTCCCTVDKSGTCIGGCSSNASYSLVPSDTGGSVGGQPGNGFVVIEF